MTTLDFVLGYVSLNLSPLPLFPRTKKPHYSLLKQTGYTQEKDGQIKVSWRKAQQVIAGLEILKVWFANGAGVALVGGQVSGNLVDLDFDTPEGYKSWALDHKAAVNSTAVEKSYGGYHVLIRTPDCKTGNLYYKGKLLGQVKGEGSMCNCAPSIHPQGVVYSWLRHPQDGIIEVENLSELGLSRQVDPNRPPRSQPKQGYYSANKRVQWVREALARLHSHRAENYWEWILVGLALSNLGDEGLQLWHEFSAQSYKYDPEELDRQWQYFDPDGDLSLGSLFYWARQDDPGGGKQGEWRVL